MEEKKASTGEVPEGEWQSNTTCAITAAKEDEFKEREISFMGVGYESVFHFGVTEWMKKNSIIPGNFAKVYATSGACIPAILWFCGIGFEKFSEWLRSPHEKTLQATCKNMRDLLESSLPENAHEIADGKFHIWVTEKVSQAKGIKPGEAIPLTDELLSKGIEVWDKLERKFISKFSSRTELIDFIEASCYIPTVTKKDSTFMKIGEREFQFSGTDFMFCQQEPNVVQISSSLAVPAVSGGLTIQRKEIDCPFDLPSEATSPLIVKQGYYACEKFRSLIESFLSRDFTEDDIKRLKEKISKKHAQEETEKDASKEKSPHSENLQKEAEPTKEESPTHPIVTSDKDSEEAV